MPRPGLARTVVASRTNTTTFESEGDDMTNAKIESIRRAAILGIVGATATAISGVVVQGAVQPETSVSDDRWSYPF